MTPAIQTSRRGFIGLCGGAAAAMVPNGALARMPERRLTFVHTHTGEFLRTTYWAGGRYLADGLRAVNRILRDFRTGDVLQIDPTLLDQLVRVRELVDADRRPLHIISGYRSPKTNAMLRAHSGKVASRSLHQEGRAIDIRIPGIDTRRIRDAGLSLAAGGVGYYGDSDFVHLDTGRVRRW